MNLGITDRKAIVCASSRGLGKACALALAREGCLVVINGRNADSLESTAAEIAAITGRAPLVVVADVSTCDGRKALLAACPAPDILVTNNGGPEPGKAGQWDHDTWIAAVEGNMLSGILLIQAVVPGMRERRFGRIVNITSAMVKSPKLMLGLSTASRAGLTAFSKAMSNEVVRDNVTINNVLPERIDTPRQEFLARRQAEINQISYEEARAKFASSIAAKRFGTPEEFADAVAYLCSAQAGFISGQNLQLDGGSYPGLM